MKKSYLVLLFFILQCLVIVNSTSPWPQTLHDSQSSRRASTQTTVPSTNLCSVVLPDDTNGYLINLPNEDTALITSFTPGNQQSTLINTTNMAKINSVNGKMIFATNPQGNTSFYYAFLADVMIIGAVTSSGESIWETIIPYIVSESFPNMEIRYNEFANAIENVVVNQTGHVTFYHINAITGDVSWKYVLSTLASSTTLFYVVGSNPLNGNPNLVVIDQSIQEINITSLDVSTGKENWLVQEYYGYFMITYVVSDKGVLVLIGAFDGYQMMGISLATGDVLWTQQTPAQMISAELGLLRGNGSNDSPVIVTSDFSVCLGDVQLDNFTKSYGMIIDPQTGNIYDTFPSNLFIEDFITVNNYMVFSSYTSRVDNCLSDPAVLLADLSNMKWNQASLISNNTLCDSMMLRFDGTLLGECVSGKINGTTKFVPCNH